MFGLGKKRCRVFMLDPSKGVCEERWVVGEDIGKDEYEKMKDKNGSIYVMRHYEEGKPVLHILHKSFWEETKRKIESI